VVCCKQHWSVQLSDPAASRQRYMVLRAICLAAPAFCLLGITVWLFWSPASNVPLPSLHERAGATTGSHRIATYKLDAGCSNTTLSFLLERPCVAPLTYGCDLLDGAALLVLGSFLLCGLVAVACLCAFADGIYEVLGRPATACLVLVLCGTLQLVVHHWMVAPGDAYICVQRLPDTHKQHDAVYGPTRSELWILRTRCRVQIGLHSDGLDLSELLVAQQTCKGLSILPDATHYDILLSPLPAAQRVVAQWRWLCGELFGAVICASAMAAVLIGAWHPLPLLESVLLRGSLACCFASFWFAS